MKTNVKFLMLLAVLLGLVFGGPAQSSMAATASAISKPATMTMNADPFVTFSGLTSSLNPSIYGDTVTFKAVVSTSGGAPAGKVIFWEFVIETWGGAQIFLGEDLTATSLGENSYEYTFSTSTLNIGDHLIFASYKNENGTSTESPGPLYQKVVTKIWPTVIITSAPSDISYSNQATFQFSSNTEGTVFECSLSEGNVSNFDNATWSVCSSPQTYTGLTYGAAYTFAVKVQGAPLTSPNMAWHPWYIAVPQVTITDGPAEITESTEATITFSSDPAGTDLVCYLVKQEFGTQNPIILENWVPCSSPRTLTGLSRGFIYYFGVKPVGAVDYLAATRQWLITKITLTASPNPSEFGSDVTFTATLWDNSGIAPGGTVTIAESFYSWPGVYTYTPIGQVSSPTASGTGSYTYTFSTSELTIGSHEIVAFYNGEGITTTIMSLSITQEVAEVTAKAPVITTQPANRTACAGSSVSFTAAASGTPAPTVQWQVSTNGGTTWNNISGATTTTYTISAAASDNGKRYRAVFTNSAGSATSSAAILTVNTVPAVTNQPANQTVTYGVPSATFSAAASGTASNVQWRSSTNGTTWGIVSGATTSNLTITNPTVLMSGTQFRAEFTNVCGTTSSSPATLTVNKAPVTATAGNYNGTFDGAAHSPSGCVLTGAYTGDLSCTNSSSSVGPNAGSGIISPSVNGTGLTNYAITSVSGNWSIEPADPICSISGYTGVYSGDALGAAGACTGINGETLTGLDLGDSFTNVPGGTAHWTFTDSSGNYNNRSGSVEIVINKADPVCSISGYTGVYDGDPHGASGFCTGVEGEILTTLDLGGSFTNVSSGTANWSFNDSSGNYTNESGSVDIVITQATPTCSISGYTGVYDGDPHGASGSCTGVKGEALADLNLGESFTNVPGGTANWSFNDSSGNYTNDSGSVNIEITKAPSTVTVTCPESAVYNGTAQTPCTAKATGSGMKPVDVTASLIYANNTNVGTATAGASWGGDANHTGNTGSDSFEITPAPVTLTAGGYSGTYDGVAHSPSECAVTGAYTGDLRCTNDPAMVGPDAGSGIVAPVVSGTGLTNYAITNVNGAWSIQRAWVTAKTSGYSGTYDGAAHSTACVITGAYTGDLSCTSSPALVGPDVGFGKVRVHDVSGTERSNFYVTPEDSWWEITLAPVTVTAGDYNGTYDGNAHPPSACAVTGDYVGDLTCTNNPASVGPDVGSGTVTVGDLSGTGLSNFWFTKVNGSWEITPAAVRATAGDYSGTYDGVAHSPSECAVTGDYTGDLTCTNDPASVGPDVGSGDVAPVLVLNGEIETNFTVTSQNGYWSISKATLTVTADNQTAQYSDASPDPLMFQYAGFVVGENESVIDTQPICTTIRLIDSPAGDYDIDCFGGDDNNYTFSYAISTFTVTHEDAQITMDNENGELVDNPGSNDSGPFSLYAYVQETYPDTGYGPAAGDISLAEVTMSLTPVGPGSGATVACTLIGANDKSGYEKIATFKCDFDGLGVNTYLVEASVVGGYYESGTAEDVLVVYDPSLGFTTAGGWFYWPGTNDKTNFGYTMMYNKKGNKVQGNLLLIRHSDDGNYRIKSNALYGLALGEFEEVGAYVGWASFSGKCTYQEPGWLEPEGNHEFMVYVEDRGESGAGYDRFWIDVDGDQGNLSMEAPVEGNMEVLNGGNIVVPHTPN